MILGWVAGVVAEVLGAFKRRWTCLFSVDVVGIGM